LGDALDDSPVRCVSGFLLACSNENKNQATPASAEDKQMDSISCRLRRQGPYQEKGQLENAAAIADAMLKNFPASWMRWASKPKF
jgi:hypothetical protein